MKDRFNSGMISGVVAGIAMNVIDWIGYLLGLYHDQLLDWGAVVIYGRFPVNTLEIAFAQAGQIFFSGLLGVVLSSLLLKLTSGNYLSKGWIYGVTTWFFIYAVSIATRLPGLNNHGLAESVSHLISASVYGIVLALMLNLLDARTHA